MTISTEKTFDIKNSKNKQELPSLNSKCKKETLHLKANGETSDASLLISRLVPEYPLPLFLVYLVLKVLSEQSDEKQN